MVFQCCASAYSLAPQRSTSRAGLGSVKDRDHLRAKAISFRDFGKCLPNRRD